MQKTKIEGFPQADRSFPPTGDISLTAMNKYFFSSFLYREFQNVSTFGRA
jgi:hypothetical protein